VSQFVDVDPIRLARRLRRFTAIEAASTTWLCMPFALQEAVYPETIETGFMDRNNPHRGAAGSLRSLSRFSRARRTVVSAARTWCLLILLLPGVLEPISQIERLSSNATNNAVSCAWAADRGWAAQGSVRRIRSSPLTDDSDSV
jgi:hypothetical protein